MTGVDAVALAEAFRAAYPGMDAQAYGGPVPSSYEVAIPAYVLEVE